MSLVNKIVLSSALMAVSSSISAESTNIYDATTGLLTLPSVNVPAGNGDFARYAATLTQLPADPAQPNQMAFSLQKAEPSQIPRDLAYFTPSVGKVAFPVSVLGANFYWVEMTSVADGIGPVKFVLDLRPETSGVTPASAIKLLTVSKSGSEAGKVKITGGGINCGNDSCWVKLKSTSDVLLTAEGIDTTKTSVVWTGCDSSTANTCTVKPGSAGIRSVEVQLNDKVGSFCFKEKDGAKIPLSSTFGSSPSPGHDLDFGSVQVNTPALTNVTIKGPALSIADDLCVQSMGLTGPNAADFKIVEPVFPENPAYLTFKPKTATPVFVQCTPSAESMRQAVLTLKTNDPSQPIISYTMKCKGIKEAQPNYWSDPFPGAEVDFGGSARNQETTTAKIFVSNRGQLPLEVYKLKVSGANATDFLFKGPNSLSLQPNEPTKAFEMSCKPSDLGFRTGVLELGSNDPDRLAITYPLKCEGTEKCVTDYPPEGDMNSDIIAPPGGGYSPKYDRLKPESCLNGKVTAMGHTEFYLDGEIVDSLEEVSKSLGVSGSLKLNFAVFKMKAAASYLRESKETERSTTYVYQFKVKFPNRRFEINQSDTLSALGKKVIRSASCWENTCGSNYVSQTTQTTDLYVFVQLNFASKAEKEQLAVSLGASYKKLASLQLAMRQFREEKSGSGAITIKAIQRGGDAIKLPNIFNAAAGEGDKPDTIDASIRCGLAQTTATGSPGGAKDYTECEKVMNNILIYAKTDFVNGATIDKSQTTGYLFNRYDELGIGSPNVDFEPDAKVIEARQKFADAYNRELDNYNIVKELQGYSLSPESKTLVSQLLSKIDYNIEVLRSMAAWCFSDLNRCPDKQVQATEFETNANVSLSDGSKVKGMLKVYNKTASPTAGATLGVDGVTLDGNRYSFSVTDNEGKPIPSSGTPTHYLIKQ